MVKIFFYDENGFICNELESVGFTEIAPDTTLNRAMFTGEQWIESIIARAWQIDDDGFFVMDLFNHDIREAVQYTTIPCPSGKFRKPRLVSGEWVEGNPRDPAHHLTKAKQAAKRRIQLELDQRIQQGMPYSFNSTSDMVQTRFERDLINISGVATRAMLLKAQGIAEPVIKFRAESNTTYDLTPDQAIHLGETVAAWIEGLYATAWALKDALHSALTPEEISTIQWPES